MKLLQVKGPDAADFLHRVTAGTVKRLEPGQGAGGLLLNGQSRMIAQFDLLKVAPDTFFLAVDDACADALYRGLEALHFAENFESGWLPVQVGIHPLSRMNKREATFKLEGASLSIVWPALVPGYACMLQPGERPLPDSFHFDRIAALVPWPGMDWDENTPALEAGTLPWIDRDKGCYPGQEVVERSINVGHPARVMMALEGEGPCPPTVRFPGGAEGKVLSHAASGDRLRLLVRAPWPARETAPQGFRILKTWA